MVEYIRKVDHATSVKEINIIAEPTNTVPGGSDFGYRPVFSVFDFGTIVPPVPLDNSTVNMMLGFNFELLQEQGIESHYRGLVTDEGELISAKEAISRKVTPTVARVDFVNRVMPKFENGKWDYSMFGDEAEVKCYVQPIEFISRNGLPEASSVWKRVKEGELKMEDLGLPADFKPGDDVPTELIPILDYSTKFEPDDRYLSPAQTQAILGVSDARFETINGVVRLSSNLMTKYAASRGFKREDGKVELVTYVLDGQQVDRLGDAVCTWHEDRLVHSSGVGISKQRIRNKVKELNGVWYDDIQAAKKRAKAEGVEDFRTLLNPEIKYVTPSAEFFEAVNNLFRAGTNQWIDAKVYDVYPGKEEPLADSLDRAVEEFQAVSKR